MTDKWKYKSVSLKNSTYSMLNDLSKTLVHGVNLSNAKTVFAFFKHDTSINSNAHQGIVSRDS